jgi:hypothetical protein
MKHDIDMSKTFKLVILYLNMHKYKADRMENHYIQYLIVPLGHAIITLKENLHHIKSTSI